MSTWFQIPFDARAWSDAGSEHKMGWLQAGSRVEIVELFDDWARFEGFEGPTNLIALGDGYNEYWVSRLDLGVVFDGDVPAPVPDPVVGPPSELFAAPTNEEIGRVVRYLFGR